MNPISAKAVGYRSYQEIAIDFPSGVTAVVGDNGSGKSSLIELIPLALFGSPTRSLADYLNTECEEMSIELTFEHAGELYRVRRQFSSRGRGKSTLDLEQMQSYVDIIGPEGGPTVEEWIPLTRETSAVTQQHLEDIIGLSRETYLASAHLSQGQGDAFTAAQPRDRKSILSQILGLGVWDRLQKHARDELRVEEDALVKLAALIAGADEQAARRPEMLAGLQAMNEAQTLASAALTTVENELDDAQRAHAAAQVVIEQVRTAEAEARAAIDAHFRASEDLAQAVAAADALEGKRIELGEVSADAAQVPALEARVSDLRAAAYAYEHAIASRDGQMREIDQRQLAHDRMLALAKQSHDESAELRRKAAHIEEHIGEASACDRCGQTLGADAAARAAASYRADADALDARVVGNEETCRHEESVLAEQRALVAAIVIPAVEDPAPVEQALRSARGALESAATLTEQIAQLEGRAARRADCEQALQASAAVVVEKQAALEALKEQATDETVLVARVGLCKVAVADARLIFDTRQAEIVRAQADLDRITEAEQQLAEHRADVEAAQSRVDLLKLAERAYGRDGIPALILEASAVPQIETEANRILAELGTTYRVELRTQAENKTNANLRETLEILVFDGSDVRAYETFSGGEKTRINLALRLALASLLATRKGASSSILCIDELDGLDSAGMDALVGVLNGLADRFSRIMLVSHQAQLATAFDQTISVQKGDDGRSRIVEARVQVPA